MHRRGSAPVRLHSRQSCLSELPQQQPTQATLRFLSPALPPLQDNNFVRVLAACETMVRCMARVQAWACHACTGGCRGE